MIEHCKLFPEAEQSKNEEPNNWQPMFFKGKENQRRHGLQDSDWQCTWQGRPKIVQLCRYQSATKHSSNIWWLLIANHCFSAGPSQLPLHETLLICLSPMIFPVAGFFCRRPHPPAALALMPASAQIQRLLAFCALHPLLLHKTLLLKHLYISHNVSASWITPRHQGLLAIWLAIINLLYGSLIVQNLCNWLLGASYVFLSS